jgi:hypothetical protein
MSLHAGTHCRAHVPVGETTEADRLTIV